MSNYIQLTLDTTAPGGVSVKINNGEEKTDSTAVRLAIACTDADLTGYQMKIWGIDGAETEASATWESFSATKDVTLSTGDGIKTVYIKVRDDVWNESAAASATIGFYTSVPTVEVINTDITKLSLVKATAVFCLAFSENIDAVKIMIVDDVNASYDDASNIAIPATKQDSAIMLYTPGIGDEFLQTDHMEFTDITVNSDDELTINLNAADILSASPGDGVKTLKAFVRSALSGYWSE